MLPLLSNASDAQGGGSILLPFLDCVFSQLFMRGDEYRFGKGLNLIAKRCVASVLLRQAQDRSEPGQYPSTPKQSFEATLLPTLQLKLFGSRYYEVAACVPARHCRVLATGLHFRSKLAIFGPQITGIPTATTP